MTTFDRAVTAELPKHEVCKVWGCNSRDTIILVKPRSTQLGKIAAKKGRFCDAARSTLSEMDRHRQHQKVNIYTSLCGQEPMAQLT